MLVSIKMSNGDEFQIELDESPTNQRRKLDKLKEAMAKGTILDLGNGHVVNGKFISSFSKHSLEED